jgi:Ni/Co efflux regulator RcnB
MQKVLDEAPEFAKKMITQSKIQREAQKKSPQYVPGPDSWRPGDPVPVEFKKERQERTKYRGGFPRGETVTEPD